MLLRHLNATTVYTLFCFGNERRLAVTSIADGLLGTLAMLALVPVLGVSGAAIGQLLGVCLVSLPNNLAALAREEGGSPFAFFRPMKPWLIRFPVVVVGFAFVVPLLSAREVWAFGLVGLAVAAVYFVVMLPVLRTPPLGPLLSPRIQPWTAVLSTMSWRPRGAEAGR
jgi:O-antigen/teichoic acid export membrane protein